MSTLSDGWKCPGCGACYAPWVLKCDSCGGGSVVVTIGCPHPPDRVYESTAGRVCGACGAHLGFPSPMFETTCAVTPAVDLPSTFEGLRVLDVRVE